jgi:hypothetical protein
LLRFLQRLGGFGRHVVLVVLGEHLAREEDAVLQLPLRDHALAFLEQVGKDAFVADRDVLGRVGDDEVDARAFALDRALADEATEPERPGRRRFMAGDLRRRVEEDEVALEGVEDERRRGAHGDDDAGDDRQALVARLHAGALPSARRACRCLSTASAGSTSMQAAVTA